MMKNLMLAMANQSIKQETGMDFTGAFAILAMRLKGKSVNQLIAEIKAQRVEEAKYTEAV